MEDIKRFQSGGLIADVSTAYGTVNVYGGCTIDNFLIVAEEIRQWVKKEPKQEEQLRKGEER